MSALTANEHAILEVRGITKVFGGLTAVDDISFTVRRGEILGIIGPNGAGKSTLFNLLSGYYKPTSGRIIYEGRDITGMRSHHCAKIGIVRMAQANVTFGDLTLLENVLVAYHLQANIGFISEIMPLRSIRTREKVIREKALDLLTTLNLKDVSDSLVTTLPHGIQRLLGLAMAIASSPKILLLDEPAAGLTPSEAALVVEEIRRIRDTGVTILLIEHDVGEIMGLSHNVLVMNFGRKIAKGKPREIANDPEVIEAYLGAEYVA